MNNKVCELREIRLSSPKIEGKKLTGRAIPYNSNSHDLGGFIERFAPGSVSDAVKDGMIEAWYLHNRTMPLGSQAAGTLRLIDGPEGLDYEIDLPDTSYAKDMRALMDVSKENIGGTSFGFYPKADGETWTRDNNTGQVIRTVTNAYLEHISPVVQPAYPATSAAIRSLTQADEELYGMKLSDIQRIILAANRGLQLNADEKEISQTIINRLTVALKTPTPNKEAAIKAMSQLLF